ncbi:hypothetical protein SPRG_19182 [Saprolegnia parasitica CBS 223.65]|uniref:Uncharacterized protein n=1 Tax=Saprolegnia parasitica (strain CBS 223.65) TaxID=695850 RepID=A0A067CSP2_SAPPC|nr:hypothetical protein SPRG_19182 [Saprolegnia parasitica CBS 223.65]KDO33548.1 hypothetical protein SPRG_19182 [Saprolegnia parasitica CBS 223.65]|eukprot:XP_012195608.1 hypothetical protein SPRG_19182 [Saprolegnia parasitica CBS 223.65]
MELPAPYSIGKASGSSFQHPVESVLDYSRATYWESFAKPTETIVLALQSKTLLSEVRILNKNAHAVDVSVAVENKRDDYITVKKDVRLPLHRESTIKLGYLPACFLRLTFKRQAQTSVSVYGIRPLGIACVVLEEDGGPALFNVVSFKTETILYGPSLPASLPRRDCLSDHISGSPEWMKRHDSCVDAQLTRLEATLQHAAKAHSYMY